MILNLLETTLKMFEPSFKELDKLIEKIIENVYYYLLTGETLPFDDHWFGGVFASQMMDEPIVFAYASSAADINEVIGKFRAEHRSVLLLTEMEK